MVVFFKNKSFQSSYCFMCTLKLLSIPKDDGLGLSVIRGGGSIVLLVSVNVGNYGQTLSNHDQL